MKRRDLIAAGSVSLIAAGSGCLNSSEEDSQDEPRVRMTLFAGNIRVGVDTEQVIDIFNLSESQLPEENQEHNVRIDVTPLEQYGVNVENLSVETTRGRWGWASAEEYNSNVDSVDITDGVIDLVIRTSEDVSEADPMALKLTGFQFTDTEAMAKIRYGLQSPDDYMDFEAGGPSDLESVSEYCFRPSTSWGFTLIDPQLMPPTLCLSSIDTLAGRQEIRVDWLTPKADEVIVEIDISVLEEYGTLGALEPLEKEDGSGEPMILGATLDSLTIDDWTILMRLVPDPDANYVSVGVQFSGMDFRIEEPVRDVSYDMTIEGGADETVETQSFDIIEDTIS